MSSILVGSGRLFKRMDSGGWLQQLKSAGERMKTRTAFMTDQHRLVRNFVVTELLQRGNPVPPADIAGTLGVDVSLVRLLLDDLEQNLFFLVRNPSGDVTWAYPVTCERTSHHLTFSTGENIFAA